MATAETIRELHRRWRQDGNGEDPTAVCARLFARSEELRKALPFTVRVVEPPSSEVGHFHLEADFTVGKLARKKGDLLCGEKRFVTLLHTSYPATCLKCLELAERLAEKE